MASVRVDSVALTDARFALLGALLGVDRHLRSATGLGIMVHVWAECTERQSYVLPCAIVDQFCDAKFLVESGLAEADGAEIRIRGTRGRIEWLGKLRKNSGKGGRATRAKWQAKRQAKRGPKGGPDEGPLTLTLTTTPSPSEKDRQLPLTPPSPAQKNTHTPTRSSSKKKRKTPTPKTTPKPPPLPFAPAELLHAFAEGAGRMYVHGPVDRGTAVQLTALIRQLDENGLGLDDVRKGGAMIAGYPEPIGAKWVAKTGNLFDVIAKSRRPRTQTEDEYTEAVPR